MDPGEVAFAYAPWFDRLVRHKEFVERLISRYKELRRGPLAPDYIDALLRDTTRYLGPARERDWRRWQSIYTGSDYALQDAIEDAALAAAPVRLRRQTDSYEQEILKIRHLLRVHGDAVAVNLRDMPYEGAASISSSDDYKRNSLIAALFLLVFAASVWVARRHGGS
jgi:hypothetical protein